MRILNSCAVWQDSILQSGVRANQSSRTPILDCLYSSRHQRSLIFLQLWTGGS